MDQKANPIPKRGDRNVCCPFYNDCLDYAVKGSWQTWNCSQCPHKLTRQSITLRGYVLNNTDPCYDLPPDVRRVIWKDAFD
jgi:hypothetical protein